MKARGTKLGIFLLQKILRGEKNEKRPQNKIPKSLSPRGCFILYMQEEKAERAGAWNWDKLISCAAKFQDGPFLGI